MRRQNPLRPVCSSHSKVRGRRHAALTVYPSFAASTDAGKLKARFESMAKASDEENRRKAEEEKARRRARESREREVARHRQEVHAHNITASEPASEPAPGGCICIKVLFISPQEQISLEEKNPDVPDVVPEVDNPPPDVRANTPTIEERPESEVKLGFINIRLSISYFQMNPQLFFCCIY